MTDDVGAEMPLEAIIQTNEAQILNAFKTSPCGLTLDDLVSITGLEKNSISGPRLNLEIGGKIFRTEERRWNLNRTRRQTVYQVIE